jgi:hypothetical protein
LSGQKTLIERNYQDRTIPGPDHLEHIANQPAEFAASQSR